MQEIVDTQNFGQWIYPIFCYQLLMSVMRAIKADERFFSSKNNKQHLFDFSEAHDNSVVVNQPLCTHGKQAQSEKGKTSSNIEDDMSPSMICLIRSDL